MVEEGMMPKPDRWCAPLWKKGSRRARLTVLPWLIWATIICSAIFLPFKCAHGAPFARASSDAGVVIDLDTEPCKLQEHIASLPKRATWTQDGKVLEGCFGVDPKRGIVIMYFEDKTIVILGVEVFVRLVSA